MGVPGLFAISFVDSAAVPLAGGPDAVILLLAWREPSMVYLIVLAATLGSTLGCLVLYGIGKKGGKKALSRFNPRKIQWVESKMREYGIWVIIASVVAPPPFPTKLAVLAAGVLRTSRAQLVSGVFIGRMIRYAVLGYLGAEFGDEAAEMIQAHYPELAVVLVAGLLIVVLIRTLRKRRANVS
jgi:membrane protein YqaA with SNARE-associated domain